MAAPFGLAGSSRAMERLRDTIRVLAPLEATVLIRGETGTGKGLVARALHTASPRAGLPFVHLDCAALAPSVVESELFGHERGAFTGAERRVRGRLEYAGRGTLFLDEVGELAPPLQAKLLRVLQDRTYERVGSAEPRPFAARVVAATHRDLEADVAAGRFRADLFFRLAVVPLQVPPLRERLEDIEALLQARGAARGGRSLGPAELRELRSRPWPGNVRELFNWLERRQVTEQLSAGLAVGPGEGGAGLTLTPAERARVPAPTEGVADTLSRVGGNVSRAARRLGMSRSALRRRIRRDGLEDLIPHD